MGSSCLKEKKESQAAAEAIPKPDTDRKYRGRKPQDDSWIEGARRQLPPPVAIIHPPKEGGSQKKIPTLNDMADPSHVPVPVKPSTDPQDKSTDPQGSKEEKPQRSSMREIKINDVRQSLKETVKLR